MGKVKAILTTLAWIPKVVSYVHAAVAWVRAQDAAGVERLSDEFWANARHSAELVVLGWAEGQDKGIRKLFQTDNQLLRGLGIWLKSDAILAICKAPASQKAEARTKLRDKDPLRSIPQ